jgi:hypothetical protein
MEYPQTRIKFRHYGKNVIALVEKAKKVEDPEKRAAFAQCIGNYMKLTYQNWNKENTNDEIIKNDLRIISKDELSLSVEDSISELSRANNRPNKPRQFQNSSNRNNNPNNFRNNNNRNSNNNNRNSNNSNRKPFNKTRNPNEGPKL